MHKYLETVLEQMHSTTGACSRQAAQKVSQ